VDTRSLNTYYSWVCLRGPNLRSAISQPVLLFILHLFTLYKNALSIVRRFIQNMELISGRNNTGGIAGMCITLP
jgi:hypothetical protein